MNVCRCLLVLRTRAQAAAGAAGSGGGSSSGRRRQVLLLCSHLLTLCAWAQLSTVDHPAAAAVRTSSSSTVDQPGRCLGGSSSW
jgi:hypothetical protein